MPELPEVETVCRGLAPVMEGARVNGIEVRRPDLRFPFPDRFADRLRGAGIAHISRRSKYVCAALTTGELLIMHLGMSGRFTIEAGGDAKQPGQFVHDVGGIAAHDHVVFTMSNGARITYNDPRRFGYMDLVDAATAETCKHFAELGVEPLGNAFHAHHLARRGAGKVQDMKAFLLDQRNVAGLGNIYVCEALHRAGISPRRKAGGLALKSGGPTDRAERLAVTIRQVLEEAIAAGGSSLRDYAQADGALGYFQHTFRAYSREGAPCPTRHCDGTIRRIVQAGRSTFFCGKCQR
ncbi:MAG: bifunctional DNA-formamidopyrimidine glycosylase/DNA-(apurinic or apyrimidinic site) lyase [Pseudomonadota bacterium]